jgi:hypothetical protein
MRMLDLFCGRFGWGRAFAARGWEVVGVDLVEPQFLPPNCQFERRDILSMTWPLGELSWPPSRPNLPTVSPTTPNVCLK